MGTSYSIDKWVNMGGNPTMNAKITQPKQSAIACWVPIIPSSTQLRFLLCSWPLQAMLTKCHCLSHMGPKMAYNKLHICGITSEAGKKESGYEAHDHDCNFTQHIYENIHISQIQYGMLHVQHPYMFIADLCKQNHLCVN